MTWANMNLEDSVELIKKYLSLLISPRGEGGGTC